MAHDPQYLAKYPGAMRDVKQNIAFHLMALDPRTTAATRQGITTTCGKCSDLGQLQAFNRQHSLFYVIQKFSERVTTFLQNAKEEQIERILTTLGATAEELASYKIAGSRLSRYNLYQIEFVLPFLIFKFCVNNAVILNPALECATASTLKPFLYDPQNNRYGNDFQTASMAKEWQYDRALKSGWNTSGTTQHGYSDHTSSFWGSRRSTDTSIGQQQTRTVPAPSVQTTAYTTSTS